MNFGTRFVRSKMGSVSDNSQNDHLDRWDNKQGYYSFVPLSGEEVKFKEQTVEGSILLSNYRVVLQNNDAIYNIPLGVIDQVEARKISFLHILCKDARSYKCTLSNSELCLEWHRKIEESLWVPFEIEKSFASLYFESQSVENLEMHNVFTSHTNGLTYTGRSNKNFQDEVRRLGFDMEGSWRVSKANEDYRLCPSYPQKIIVPSSISDNHLEGVARFRSSKRIPAVVWRHPNGAVIARSSQPEVGWLGWRSSEDEDLLKAFAEACAYDSPLASLNKIDMTQVGKLAQNIMDNSELWLDNPDSKRTISGSSDTPSLCDLPEARSQNDIKKLLIVDARSYGTALANRARGGGCECPEYYPTCSIQFMNLDNIHGIRKSQHSLRHLVSLPPDIPNWLSLLDNSRWLAHVSGLLRASVTIAQTVAIEARPVLIHCSDGWDRTPQLTSLAQLLMDPFYRTLQGFQILVDREWIEFGHKFSDRCGCGTGAEDSNEISPIFLQWLDCVHQLLLQFPTSFQFNQAYLVKLSQHVYSNMFGTFMFNSSMKRNQADQKAQFYSVWSMFKLHQHQYINLLFIHTNQVLYPSCHAKDMELWKAVYTNKIEKNVEDYDMNGQNDYTEEEDEELLPSKMVKTRSCNSLADPDASPVKERRCSDPNVRDSLPDLVMLKSAIGTEILDDQTNQADSNQPSCNVLKEETIECLKNSYDIDLILSSSSLSNGENWIEPILANQDAISSHRSNLSKKSIEGSTDTLVAENGHLETDFGKLTVNPDKNGQISSDSTAKVDLENNVRRKLSPREPDSLFSMNASLKNNAMKFGLVSIHTDGVSKPAPQQEDFSKYNCSSSVAECSFCFQSRKSASGGAPLENGFQRQNSKGVRYSTPGHSRSPSSGIASTSSNERSSFSATDKYSAVQSVDGLSNFTDEVGRRLEQINYQHQIDIDNLKRELQRTKSFYVQLIQSTLSHHNHENHSEDQVSLPESVGSGGSVGHESGLSDVSWENIDDGDSKTTLWVPDHAVDHCMGCHSAFWLGRRKHHCRSCGKIFCNVCSENCAPIPKENLHEPVRVCGSCFTNLIVDFKFRPIPVASN